MAWHHEHELAKSMVKVLAALMGAAVLGFQPALGEWPQWRGAGRDGAVDAAARAEWPADLALVWERQVGGGYSGPVVADGRVFVHARQGEAEVVSAYAVQDGAELWRRQDDVPFRQDGSALAHGRGPYATPAVAGSRLFTLSVTAVLSVRDTATGRLLWRRDTSSQFPWPPYFGAATSPLVWNDRCFVHFGGHERDRPGDPWKGAMIALGVADGAERWRWDGDGPSVGASPVIDEVAGRPQLVFKSLRAIVGLDPQSGRELWRIRFQIEMNNTIVTPLFLGDVLLTSDWESGFHAWRVRRDGEDRSLPKLWHTSEVWSSMSSPVVAAGQLVAFVHQRQGQLVGLDPGSGEVLWRGEGRWGEHASLVAWGDQVLVFREDGSLVVGEVGADGFRPLASYRLGNAGTWTHPAVLEDLILVKDGDRLLAYRIPNPSSP